MTNEEAIKELKAEKIAHINNEYSGTTEHFDLAIEALEMQTPKKPKIDIYKIPICPHCFNDLCGTKFCLSCGQKLDRS